MMKFFSSIAHAALIATLSIFLAMGTAVAASSESENGPSAQEVRDDLAEALESMKGYAVAKRDLAYDKGAQALEVADRFIERQQDRLSENWNAMTAEARKEAKDAMAAVRKQRNETGEWLGRMKEGSAEAWDEIKDGFVDAYAALSEAVSEGEKKAE